MPSRLTQKLSVTELDFDNIKNSLKNFLKNQGEFTDYNFEGSSLSVLLDLLAYNTHYNAFYANMIANEMFLDSAGARSSVVSRSKHLAYIPRSTRGATAFVNLRIQIPTADSNFGSLLIPKGHTLTSTFEGTSYSFLTEDAVSVIGINDDLIPASTIFEATNLPIKEGVASSYQYAVSSSSTQKFVIPNDNVDTSTISISVYDTVAGTTKTNYSLYEDYTILNGDSQVFFIQEIADGRYEIYFGDGVIGKMPEEGNIVEISYNVVRGFDASQTEYVLNGQDAFDCDPIPNPSVISSSFSDITVTTISPAGGGVLPETIGSIKYLAPLNYQAQSRAVTKSDYKSRLLTDYTNLDAVGVWGGEEVVPPDYGTVYISLKPAAGYIISDFEKEKIANEILKTRNLVTIRPKFIDPEYIYITTDVSVKYDSRTTARSAATLNKMVQLAIIDFSNNNLNDFDQYFKHSVLTRDLDGLDSAITNSLLTISLQKDLLPILNSENNYSIDFANPLYHPHSGHQGTIKSSLFNYDVYTNCGLFDVDGVLKIYYTNPNEGMTFVHENVGSIDYDTGKLELTAFNPSSYVGAALIITAIPRQGDIISTTNTLLSIRTSGINITMVDDSDITTGTTSIARRY